MPNPPSVRPGGADRPRYPCQRETAHRARGGGPISLRVASYLSIALTEFREGGEIGVCGSAGCRRPASVT